MQVSNPPFQLPFIHTGVLAAPITLLDGNNEEVALVDIGTIAVGDLVIMQYGGELAIGAAETRLNVFMSRDDGTGRLNWGRSSDDWDDDRFALIASQTMNFQSVGIARARQAGTFVLSISLTVHGADAELDNGSGYLIWHFKGGAS